MIALFLNVKLTSSFQSKTVNSLEIALYTYFHVFDLLHRLNRKLKGVVYNPMAMEYTTKWHQPSYLGPKSKNPQPKISHSGRHKGPQLDSRFDTGFNKPYGKLTIKELVQHLERLRRESPFAEDFKMNDPVSMRTKPASQSTSRTSSVGSGLSAESSSIQMKPVIPDMKLSTPVFEQPKKAKEVRKQDDKTTKTLGEQKQLYMLLVEEFFPFTMTVLCVTRRITSELHFQVQILQAIHKACFGTAKFCTSEQLRKQ